MPAQAHTCACVEPGVEPGDIVKIVEAAEVIELNA